VLISEKTLTPRLRELVLSTDLLDSDETNVRVLLPQDYDASDTSYPVVYLYHGGLEDYAAWTDKGNAEALTAGLPLIAVMPDCGAVGHHMDWFNNGAFGRPQWETYEIDRLIPFIDEHYRTTPSRQSRAAAGVSLGGYGALANAARHPDLFGAAAAFSGAVDITTPTHRGTLEPVAGLIFGTWDDHEARWRANNPADLAANFAETDLALYVGNGPAGIPAGIDNLEAMVKDEALNLHTRLDELGIPHIWHVDPTGDHDWPWMSAYFEAWLPRLMTYFTSGV
jgi:S-formylglutathione hydrolase FrmB